MTTASNPQPEQGSTPNRTPEDQLQLVSFWIGEEEFAIDILRVREINRMMLITRVPESADAVEGVINLRGLIVPVIDLRKQFSVEHNEQEVDESRIVVVDISGRVIGFIVDRVNEVLRIDRSIVDPPPSMMSGKSSDFIQGVGKLKDRLLILLDLDKLFNAVELSPVVSPADAA